MCGWQMDGNKRGEYYANDPHADSLVFLLLLLSISLLISLLCVMAYYVASDW